MPDESGDGLQQSDPLNTDTSLPTDTGSTHSCEYRCFIEQKHRPARQGSLLADRYIVLDPYTGLDLYTDPKQTPN